MPYPSEHAARIEAPDDFAMFRRKNSVFGPGIDVIFGVKDGVAMVQSIRFDAKDYTAKQARAWLRKHHYDPLEFAPATGRQTRRNPSNPARSRYTSAHWGKTPAWARKVEHPEIPERRHLVQMGELLTLQYRDPPSRRLYDLAFRPGHAHLAFLPDESERLVVLLAPEDRTKAAKMVAKLDGPWEHLDDVAERVGGRQADFTCPDVMVRCLGRFTRVVYRTDKEGDGESDYVHRMGEEGGVEPMLCVDARGDVYIAGGSYRVPDRGIIH